MSACVGYQIDYAVAVEHWLPVEDPEVADEALKPWRYVREREDVGLPVLRRVQAPSGSRVLAGGS